MNNNSTDRNFTFIIDSEFEFEFNWIGAKMIRI